MPRPEDFGAVRVGPKPEDFGATPVSAAPTAYTQQAAPSPAHTDLAEQVFDAPGDIGATVLSGLAATPIAGLAGLAGAALPGQPGQGARTVEATERALTYEPRTEAGKAARYVMGIPGKLWNPVVEAAGEKTFEKTGSPLAAALAKGATAAAPSALGLKAGKALPKAAPALSMEEKAALSARQMGLKLTAEEAHAGPISKFAESVSGEPTFSKVIARANQPRVNEIVAGDIGVPRGTDFTPELFQQLRKDAGVPYAEMRGIGWIKTDAQYAKDLDAISSEYKTAARDFPEQARPDLIKFVDDMKKPLFAGDSGIDMVGQLRQSANAAFAKGDKGLGMAMKETAQAIEDQMGRHLEKTSAFQPPELLKRWREARVRLAKINLADEALNPATGDIDPTVYARALKKKKPLTGDAKKLGEAALAHERSMRSTAKLGATGPSWWDLIVGAGTRHHLLFGLRPGLRALLSSGPYQKMFMRPGPGIMRRAVTRQGVPEAAGVAAGAQQPPEEPPVTATPPSLPQNEDTPITSVRG